MFKWNKPLAAIDIGSHSIKLVQLKGKQAKTIIYRTLASCH